MLTYDKTYERIYFPIGFPFEPSSYRKIVDEILTLVYGAFVPSSKVVSFSYHLSKENTFDGVIISPTIRRLYSSNREKRAVLTNYHLKSKTVMITKKGGYMNVAKLRAFVSAFEETLKPLFEIQQKKEDAEKAINTFRDGVLSSMKKHRNDYITINGTPENPSILATLRLEFSNVTEFQQIYGLIRGLILDP